MKIYTIVHTYIGYDNPAYSFVHIVGSCKSIEKARKVLEAEVRETFSADEWEFEENYEEFIKSHFRSEDCWAEETCEDYTEINIVENEILDLA